MTEVCMTENVVIRDATYSDMKVVKRLHDEVLCVKYSNRFYDELLTSHKLHLYVAEVNNEVVGFASFGEEWEDDENAYVKKCGLLTLGVTKRYQNKGIGGTLLEYGFKEMENKQCSYVYLHALTTNTKGLEFYKKHSFQIVSLIPKYYHFDVEGPDDAYLLRRELKETKLSIITYCIDSIRDCLDLMF